MVCTKPSIYIYERICLTDAPILLQAGGRKRKNLREKEWLTSGPYKWILKCQRYGTYPLNTKVMARLFNLKSLGSVCLNSASGEHAPSVYHSVSKRFRSGFQSRKNPFQLPSMSFGPRPTTSRKTVSGRIPFGLSTTVKVSIRSFRPFDLSMNTRHVGQILYIVLSFALICM